MRAVSATRAAQLTDLLARAGYSCECKAGTASACGKPHKPTGGMCIVTNSATPLHVVARRDVPSELAATLPAQELMLLCDGCHAALLAHRRKTRTTAPAPDALF
ncbi:hypothetical protein JYK22_12290, partial [Nonomuraea sp. RK-328]|nr:hypothetical protein [Nonomuraea sp. RK-328]